MLISVHLIIAGLYFPAAGVAKLITTVLLITGIVLLIAGIIFYKILKAE